MKFDYELALAVLIGKRGRRLSLDNAMGYFDLFGGKAIDDSCPLGPAVVPARYVDHDNPPSAVLAQRRAEAERQHPGHDLVHPGTPQTYTVTAGYGTRRTWTVEALHMGMHREAALDRLTFAADGSIEDEVPTLESVAPLRR